MSSAEETTHEFNYTAIWRQAFRYWRM